MLRVSVWSEGFYQAPGHMSYFWHVQAKWVTWASYKQYLAAIIIVTYLVITGPNN